MSAAQRAGRIIGVMILAQMICGFVLNFVLGAPLHGPPGYLVNAAAHAPQIAGSVLFGLAAGALPVGIAITAFGVLRDHSSAAGLWLIVLASVGLAVTALEQIDVMSMLSLSEAYTAASTAERPSFEVLRAVVAAPRNWSHYVGLIVSGSTILLLNAVLCRFSLVPRAIAIFGIAAALLQLSVVAMPLFGHDIVFSLLAPLGVSQLLLSIWLIARGLPETPTPRLD